MGVDCPEFAGSLTDNPTCFRVIRHNAYIICCSERNDLVSVRIHDISLSFHDLYALVNVLNDKTTIRKYDK